MKNAFLGHSKHLTLRGFIQELVAILRGIIHESLQYDFYRYNWWGTASPAEILQRVFDFDDWNIYCVGEVNPYFTNQERFINWEWTPSEGQQGNVIYIDPSPYDLKGRLFDSVTLKREQEKWPNFPYHYKPERPYRITKDLTIMPGATLTIEKGRKLCAHLLSWM